MAQEKINIVLKKIQTIIGPHGDISSLEKDLIKGYLRELYELVENLGQEVSQSTKPKDDPAVETLMKVKTVPEPPEHLIKSKQTFAFEEEDQHKEEIITEHTPPIRQPSTPDITSAQVEIENGKQLKKSVERAPAATYSRDSIEEVVTAKPPTSSDFADFFSFENAKDLSEQLSRKPIEDLHKAFSINDRMLITDRLFNGSSEVFLDTLDILNSKHSFADAKVYLTRYVIEKFNWLDEGKKDQARDFINLVSRRYLD